MRRRTPSRLLFEIDVGERLPVGVADDEAGVGFLDGPGRLGMRGLRWNLRRSFLGRREAFYG